MRSTHNIKKFLVPESSRSMATFHAKVMEDSVMKLTIHDCRNSVQLWNDLKEPEQIKEAIDKLEVLGLGIFELRQYIIDNYTKKK